MAGAAKNYMAKGSISLSLVVLQGSNPDRKSTNNKQREIARSYPTTSAEDGPSSD